MIRYSFIWAAKGWQTIMRKSAFWVLMPMNQLMPFWLLPSYTNNDIVKRRILSPCQIFWQIASTRLSKKLESVKIMKIGLPTPPDRHIERFKNLFQEKVLWRKLVSKQKHTLYFKSINGVENWTHFCQVNGLDPQVSRVVCYPVCWQCNAITKGMSWVRWST